MVSSLYEGTTPVEISTPEEGYHFMDATTGPRLWIGQQSTGPRPAVLRVLPSGATRAFALGRQVPGPAFGELGRLRNAFARQGTSGIPADCQLTARYALPAWDDMPGPPQTRAMPAPRWRGLRAFWNTQTCHVRPASTACSASVLTTTRVFYIADDNGASAGHDPAAPTTRC